MAERKIARLRVVFIVLVIANFVVFAYFAFRTDPRLTAVKRIEEVQITPGRIRLLAAAARGGGQAGEPVKAGAETRGVCLEWAAFSAADVPGAERALERLSLPHPAIKRSLGEAGGAARFAFVVRDPDPATVARIAGVQKNFPGTEIKAAQCAGEGASSR